MSIHLRSRLITLQSKLHKEVDADTNISTELNYLNIIPGSIDNLQFDFVTPLTAPEETALTNLVTNFVDSEPQPKILSHTTANNKDFHNINYKTEMISNLFAKRQMVKGEVRKVEWFSDEALTDLVLVVDITYVRDGNGFAVERTTIRTWKNDNDSDNEDKKITKKKYSTNVEDQIKEGKRRRQNIVDYVQLPTMSFMVETMQPMTVNEILLLGRDFMDRMEPEANNFVKSSSTVTDINDPNFGKKKVVVWLETQTDTWLDNQPVALGGATIRQWLVGEFTI